MSFNLRAQAEEVVNFKKKKRNTFFSFSKFSDKLTNQNEMFCVERNYSIFCYSITTISILPVVATSAIVILLTVE